MIKEQDLWNALDKAEEDLKKIGEKNLINGTQDLQELLEIQKKLVEKLMKDEIWTPLTLAISTGNVKVAMLLIRAGVDVNEPEGNKNSPLHVAASTLCIDIIPYLLEAGASVNSTNNAGETPLHLVFGTLANNIKYADDKIKKEFAQSAELRCRMAILLIEAGASVTAGLKNARVDRLNHESPADLATEGDLIGIMPLLRKKGASFGNMLAANGSCMYLMSLLDVREIEITNSCFDDANLYHLANIIEHQYLIQQNGDHLLTNRSLMEKLIKETFAKIKVEFFKPHLEEINRFRFMQTQEELIEVISTAICSYLQYCFLYQRQEEIFWRKYIESMLFEDKEHQNQSVLPDLFIPVISELVNEYNFTPAKIPPNIKPCLLALANGVDIEKKLVDQRKAWICQHLTQAKLTEGKQEKEKLNDLSLSPCSPLVYVFKLEQKAVKLIKEKNSLTSDKTSQKTDATINDDNGTQKNEKEGNGENKKTVIFTMSK